MAHFAKITEDNKVLTVLTVDNKDVQNSEGVEVESIGQAYLEKHNNWPAHLWIQTSYNTAKNVHKWGGTPFRGNYAGIGATWDSENQIFWGNSPYPSWVKDVPTASWKSPIGDAPELTSDEKKSQQHYEWQEASQTWQLTEAVPYPEATHQWNDVTLVWEKIV
jgi:hypothetical protein